MNARRALAYVALAGAAAASTLHLAAMFGFVPLDMSSVVLLVGVAFPAVGALVLHTNARSARAGGTRATPFDGFAEVPRWGRVLCGTVFLYAGVNFAAFFAATGGGTLEKQADGSYILSDHGRRVRALDAEEVLAFQAWEVRLFSGHLLPFLVSPGLYFLFAPSVAERKPAEPAP